MIQRFRYGMPRTDRHFELELGKLTIVIGVSIEPLAPVDDNLIVINKPENDLHPIEQAKLVEELARDVNSGIPIIITTFSPYILGHFNILVSGTSDPTIRDRQAKLLYLRNPKSILCLDDIRAYELVAGGQIIDLLDQYSPISWGSLDEMVYTQNKMLHEIHEIEYNSTQPIKNHLLR